MTKTRQDNDLIACIGAVYAENKIELSRPIKKGVVQMKTIKDNDITNRTYVVYVEKNIVLS